MYHASPPRVICAGESGQLGRKVTYELKEEAEPGERPEYNLDAVYNQHLKPVRRRPDRMVDV